MTPTRGCGRLAAEQAVRDWDEKQRKAGGDEQPTDNRPAERGVLLTTLAQSQAHGKHSDDHRGRSHQHRTEAG